MLRKTLFSLLLIAPTALFAQDGAVPAETQEQIVAMLAEMQCEMDVADIEADGDGYELDDVFCADGQYDIDLDADLQVTNKRKE